jgi:predicted MFS family arabinose efflux permease
MAKPEKERDSPSLTREKGSSSKRLVPSLFFTQLSTRPSAILTGFVLIDIATSFGVSLGVMGQIITASSVLGTITALLMGVFSVRYNKKPLVITGLILISTSAIGCFLAQNYYTMLIAYSLNGVGVAIVVPLTIALVGEHLQTDERPSAIGRILSSTGILSVITGFVISYITSGGWRIAYLSYVLTISIMSLTAAFLGISSTSNNRNQLRTNSYFEGVKRIFSNKSAISCLLGAILSEATWTGLIAYGISFYRQSFLMSTEWTGIIWSVIAFCFIVGNLTVGRLVKKFGRKTVTFASVFLMGLFMMSFMNIQVLWLSIISAMFAAFSGGLRLSSSNSLTLEQVPEYRGSMMSINSAARNIGYALGSGIGGMILLLLTWRILGAVLGVIGLIATLIYFIFTVDPTKV